MDDIISELNPSSIATNTMQQTMPQGFTDIQVVSSSEQSQAGADGPQFRSQQQKITAAKTTTKGLKSPGKGQNAGVANFAKKAPGGLAAKAGGLHSVKSSGYG